MHQYRGYRTVINPAITWRSARLYEDWEGCLSVPKVQAMVRRHWKIRVQYWTPEGERVEQTLSGLVGRVSLQADISARNGPFPRPINAGQGPLHPVHPSS